MAMTLEQVRDWHKSCADALDSFGYANRHTGDDDRSAVKHRAMADAINGHLSHVMQDTERGLPPGYRVASRDGEYWPLHGDSYATSSAFPTRELAALAAWAQAYEMLSSRMETVRRVVG